MMALEGIGSQRTSASEPIEHRPTPVGASKIATAAPRVRMIVGCTDSTGVAPSRGFFGWLPATGFQP